MKIKLAHPRPLKLDRTMFTWKLFVQALMANLLSIGLTFGTSAFVDYKKKQKEKRDIVLMVMYDLNNSLASVEQSDADLQQLIQLQQQVAADTTLFATEKERIAQLLPKPKYTEATENIFTSSIETINTVGSIQFTQLVSEFYLFRGVYKNYICETLLQEVGGTNSTAVFQGFRNADFFAKDFLDVDFTNYALMTKDVETKMQRNYADCQKIVKVTDEEIESYRNKLK